MIYEYHCQDCNKDFEVEYKISENPKIQCEFCKSKSVVRQISSTNFVLNGKGWARDGYQK